MEDKVDVIVPCRDERVDVVWCVIRSCLSLEFTNSVIFVDDGSKVEYRFPQMEKLISIRNSVSIGKTASVLRALEYVSTDFVVLQDADWEYPVENLKNLYYHIKPKRMVVAKRFVPIDKLSLSGYIANRVIRFFTKEPDTFSGQRIVPVELLKKINPSGSFTLETSLTLMARKMGMEVLYVDSLYYPRGYSEGKKAKPWHMLPILLEVWRARR
jgi:glycosyltransferase involved in cell wall biosynthesis